MRKKFIYFIVFFIVIFIVVMACLFIRQKYFSQFTTTQVNILFPVKSNNVDSVNIQQKNDSSVSLASPSLPLTVSEKKSSSPRRVIPNDLKVTEAKKRRDKLLSTLRTEPFFDQNTTYQAPSDKCTTETSSLNINDISKLNLALSSGIYIGIDNEMTDIHFYDENGGHTGLISVPGFDFAYQEENTIGVQFMKFGRNSYLSIHKNIDGKIKIIGKKYGTVMFEIRGDGNTCGFVNIQVPVTPYSVGTLPITLEGDMGPFSYDIDGDGKQDFILSLLHPLLPEKQIQLDAVIADMKTAQ